MKKAVLIILIAVGVGAGVWLGYFRSSSLPKNILDANSPGYPTSHLNESLSPSSAFYSNEYYHFTLVYPKELAVNEYKEDSGARTIVFQSRDGAKGFQIFVFPYKGQQISKERFKLDEPSGVIKDPVDVLVDGVRGTIFYGYNETLGDTRELWIISHGFLYEIMSAKDFDAELASIMKTWKFIP